MKHFACGDVVPGCAAVFSAPNDEALFAQIATHAHDGHGIRELSTELVESVKQHITAA